MNGAEKRRAHTVAVYISLAVMFILLWLLVSLYFAFVCLAIGLAVVLRLDSRIPYVFALIFLLMAALFAALSYDSAANWLASIGFYGMAMGIVIQFSGFVRRKKVAEEESSE
jgi:hypothetical protein